MSQQPRQMTLGQAMELVGQHEAAGRLAEAETLLRNILAAVPRSVDAHVRLGLLYQRAGHHAPAVEAFRAALAIEPTSHDALLSLGLSCSRIGRDDEATSAYTRAAEAHPRSFVARFNCANALLRAGRAAEAVAGFEAAVALNLASGDALLNLGNALRAAGRADASMDAYRRAIAADANCYRAMVNLGSGLTEAGRHTEAEAVLRRAAALAPGDAAALNALGHALYEAGAPPAGEPLALFRRGVELDPGNTDVRLNLANALAAIGALHEAADVYRTLLPPDSAGPRAAAEGRAHLAHSNLLLMLQGDADADVRELSRHHRQWDELHARRHSPASPPAFAHDPDPDRPLRIGYVSADLKAHPVAAFVEPILRHHDRSRFDITVYANLPISDATTARLRALGHRWRDVHALSDDALATLVRDDQIDLLVDLSGHTSGNRLLAFARRPAPVQLTYLGYPDTTGLSAIDYRITDTFTDPPHPDVEQRYSEQLLRVDPSFFCFQPPDAPPDVAPAPCLAGNGFTFASVHKPAKLPAPLLRAWGEILRRSPGSRLVLVSAGLALDQAHARLRDTLVAAGARPDQLHFRDAIAFDRYLAGFAEFDLLLDCHPFSGHTSACYSLLMGVPVLTRCSDDFGSPSPSATHRARIVAGLLRNVGLPEFVAASPEAYIERAVALAADPAPLIALRPTLRQRLLSSPACDAPTFTAALESAYRRAWHTRCASQAKSP